MKIKLSLLFTIGGILLMSEMAMAANGVTATEVIIGCANAKTGISSFLGVEYSKGINAYLKQINDAGGVNGRKIKLIEYDDKYEPNACIAATTKLMEADKVLALLGYVGTPTTKAVVPLLVKDAVSLFFPFTGADYLRDVSKCPTVFNLRGSYNMETEKLVAYLVGQGKNKIAVFSQDDSYGQAGLNGVKDALKKRGLELVAEGTYKRNTTAVNEGLMLIKKESPDAVIMVGTYEPTAAFVRNAKKIGMNAIFASVSFVGPEMLVRELGADGEGVLVCEVVPLPSGSSFSVVKEYQAAMKKYFSGSELGHISLEGFVSAKTFCEILKRAGSNLDSKTLLDAANNLKGYDPGFNENIGFTSSDHEGLKTVYLTVIKGGKLNSI